MDEIQSPGLQDFILISNQDCLSQSPSTFWIGDQSERQKIIDLNFLKILLFLEGQLIDFRDKTTFKVLLIPLCKFILDSLNEFFLEFLFIFWYTS